MSENRLPLSWCEGHTGYGPAQESLVLIAYAQILLISANSNVFSEARGLNFGLRLFLYLHLYASSECSGAYAQTHISIRY